MVFIKTMKTRYITALVVLILSAVVFEALLFCTSLGEHTRLGNAVQGAGIFVALIAAVIALAAVDRKKKKIKVEIKQTFAENKEHYKESMSEQLKENYRNAPDVIHSAQVHFSMTNVSDFDLVKPTFTFRLPNDRQHPHRRENEDTWSVLSFNWNLNTSRTEFSTLQFGDTLILSNSGLPYWNRSVNLTIWIRVTLDYPNIEPFKVEVSVNCENADGITKSVTIDPSNAME